jgi:DNA topoisomerase I
MPRKQRPQSQQDIHIPVNPEDVKRTTEVLFKEIPREQIERVESVGNRIDGKLKTTKKRKKKEETTKPVKRTGGGYTLIITEKPQAAQKIAQALGDARKYAEDNVPYYELKRDGKKIVVACAVGHLFNLTQEKGEKGWPIFNLRWVAEFKKNIWAKKYYTLLKKLVLGASDFIVATDYDIEGEVIGLNIVRFIANQQDAKRMKFSSLTKPELEQAYNNLSPTLNWGQAIAGESRHYLDWLYGINLSRALMEAIKSAGSFRIMSVGRVQGPALNLVVEKEMQIKAFKSEPYWQVFIIVDGIEFKYPKDLTKKSELIPFQNIKGKQVDVKTEKSEQFIKPPTPFDLTTLQTEAYKFYGINPARTLQIAQNLYLAGLISYPRTSSQKIPDAINPLEIIKRLGKAFSTELCVRKKPFEGPKSDPAHPSIYPTGEFSSLEGEEKKLYELIARRFLACFCEDAIIDNKTLTALLGDLRFIAKGMSIRKKAWMEVYKTKMQERELPDMNGKYIIEDSRIDEKQTQPPNRYSPASLVRELEKRNLGTKATRASIVETLYNRGYIKDQSIEATPLGISLIETLAKHVPIIIDEKLTRNFEKEMDSLQTANRNLLDKEKKVLDDAKATITKISEKFKSEQAEIGKELLEANKDLREQERQANELTECPNCKKGKLRILYNKMSKRYFIGCSAYPECKTTFTLPPNGLMKPSRDRDDKLKLCEECGFPKMLAIRKAKRPWEYCFNPQCPTRVASRDKNNDTDNE